jgi:hypothetical protein
VEFLRFVYVLGPMLLYFDFNLFVLLLFIEKLMFVLVYLIELLADELDTNDELFKFFVPVTYFLFPVKGKLLTFE